MGERTQHPPGAFSWVELSTPDQDAAKAFYGDLLGWDYSDQPVGEGVVYSMAQIRGKNVAAIQPMRPEMEGHPPYWASYISVESADDTARRAAELGGKVLAEPFDVFDSGRMTFIQDPQGATFGVWQANQHIGAQIVNEPGTLVWNGLTTTDPDAAKRFYGELFGWTDEPFGGDGPPSWNFRRPDGNLNGSVIPAPPGTEIPPNWGVAFTVEDVEAWGAKLEELGGRVMIEPSDMGGIGRFLIAQDPQGAVFALYEGQIDP